MRAEALLEENASVEKPGEALALPGRSLGIARDSLGKGRASLGLMSDPRIST